MSHTAREYQTDNSASGGLRFQSPLAVLSAFAVSVILHSGLVLVMLIWGVRGCGDGSMIVSEGESRLVGIYVKQPSDVDKQTDQSDSTETNEAKQDTQNAAPQKQNLKVSDAPPVEIRLPDRSKAIGLGSAAPAFSGGNIGDVVRPNDRKLLSPSVKGLGPGEVSFFNAKDKGSSIVFVIDTSSSMYGKPIQVALAELSASVQSLQPNQLFQIVFYDSTVRVMRIRGPKEKDLYRAGQFVKTLALQEIAGVTTQGGTSHKPALIAAINMNPEIIFLLTDAQTLLTARELEAIRRLNREKIRIHCIEFGEGSNLSDSNFLKQLARENGGTYRYRDVEQF